MTHLAQIAAMADSHYYINKYAENDSTFTAVSLLDENGMVREISRLSGGIDISSQAMENAEEMKKWSTEYKRKL